MTHKLKTIPQKKESITDYCKEHINIPYIDDNDEKVTNTAVNALDCKNDNRKDAEPTISSMNNCTNNDEETRSKKNKEDSKTFIDPKKPSRKDMGAVSKKTVIRRERNHSEANVTFAARDVISGRSACIEQQARVQGGGRGRTGGGGRVLKKLRISFGKFPFYRNKESTVKDMEGKSANIDHYDSAISADRKKIQPVECKKVKPSERKLIRSLSDLGQVQFAAIQFKKPSKKAVAKKEMAKDWTKSYDKMCKRAQMLNLAIETAEKDDLSVKPVNMFNTDIAGEKRKPKEQKLDLSSLYIL